MIQPNHVLTLAVFSLLPALASAHDAAHTTAGVIRSATSGNWSAAATWNAGRVPTATDVVGISAGTTVTYDVETTSGATAQVVGVRNGGTLRFSTSANTRLVVTTLLVSEGGALDSSANGASRQENEDEKREPDREQ